VNAKSLTIGGALTALAVGIIYQYGEMITPDFLLLSALVVAFVLISYGLSWGATQAYKVLYLNRKTWHKEPIKRKIYRCAIWSASLTMLAFGSAFLLAEDLTVQERVIVSVFWLIACAVVGLSSPLVWTFVFNNLMPRLKQWARGSKTTVIRNEHGKIEKVIDDGKTVMPDEFANENEALDRPSEVPRD